MIDEIIFLDFSSLGKIIKKKIFIFTENFVPASFNVIQFSPPDGQFLMRNNPEKENAISTDERPKTTDSSMG